ncbi:MAG: molybdopterin oxidoreductase [Candidatus Abyssobacteria bacterium SURF_5]|uniref:Molybdopterin oxidoreductase n=1 Tax=Abyssobacteria bacterium (strain SURF_5) TaxID=2093360 RepID=A0A3A4NSW1_ABYX5|nr:MAG: molybdopterin oxidoreductase [Candidatus Abyssubacteria bacterium SURF_5]
MSKMKRKNSLDSWLNPEFSRRKFIKVSGILASAATVTNFIKPTPAYALTAGEFPPDPLESDAGVDIKYSVCLMCHGSCGIRAKVVDGVLVKIDGNPYHPNCLEPGERLSYATPVNEARNRVGTVCVKGQSGVQTVYNPYRLLGPIKRAPGTKRGEGQWVSITWEQAIDEIAQILSPYADTGTLIDPSAPELGPIANKVLFSPGRLEHGQKEFTDRFFKNQLGTINHRHDHTSICETSHHVAGSLTTDGKNNHFKPDVINCRYILYIGTNPLEAGFPMNPLSRKTMEFKKRGGKMVVVDPRFSNTAAKADQWVPIKPGGDAAFALAMIQYMIGNGRYDGTYLSNANISAALESSPKEYSFTDSTFLVRIVGGRAAAYLRADEAGLPGGTSSEYVILDESNGTAVALPDPANTSNPARRGLLEAPGDSIVVNGHTCKTAFTLLKEQANARTMQQWAELCGISVSVIENIAIEFTSHGKNAVANPYRGPCKHTNGTYNVLCILALNTLIGSMNWKGGNTVGGGHWHEADGKGAPGSVDVTSVPGGATASGIQVTRVKANYETDAPAIFARDGGYPARRPWFPHAQNGNFQEILPSIADRYPYGIDVLFTYWNDMVYTTPAARATYEAILADESLIPHFIAFSLEPDETSCWADYILPDPSYLERWGTPHVAPTIQTKVSSFRQPVVGDFDADMNYTPAVGDTMLIEDFFVAVAKRLGLPGVGAGAFADGDKLDNAWDWYRKLLNNFSAESGVSANEILAKGGIFEGDEAAYDGEYMAHRYQGIIRLFIESLATTKDSMTGEFFDGVPKYEPIKDVMGNELVDDVAQYPFALVTYKPVNHTQSRTIVNPWLVQVLMPENYVEMNASDAGSLGIETGDMVKVSSISNSVGIKGKAKVTQGMRPGVAAISQSYGHWQLNSRPTVTIDGMLQDYDAGRGKGLQGNQVLRLDPVLGNVTLQDKIGGSASFYNSRVRIEKI